MTDAKSAAERLMSTRAYCTGNHHPVMNPMSYAFSAADVFAVANRCLELEAEVARLHEAIIEIAELHHCSLEEPPNVKQVIHAVSRNLDQRCEAERQLESENAKLRKAVRKWVDVTTMIGTHRTCNCIACQELQRVISKKGGEA